MVEVVGNRRAALRFFRVLLVCSLFAIGLAVSARADDFQYTVTFDPSNVTGDSFSVSFDTTSLLGSTTVNINPSDGHVVFGPHPNEYVSDISVSDNIFSVVITSERCPGGCGIPGYLDDVTTGTASFLTPITAPGTDQITDPFLLNQMTDHVIGGGDISEYPNTAATVTLMVTPEPSTWLTAGSAFLLCVAFVMRRKIRSGSQTMPKIL
jgi:hypothetical protein